MKHLLFKYLEAKADKELEYNEEAITRGLKECNVSPSISRIWHTFYMPDWFKLNIIIL